jgi:ankyrin repeat protein/predicted Ser/Thr protein kinase
MSDPVPLRRVGKYEIISPIAIGGMGTVYRARDPLLEREVALKLIRGGGDAESRARFEREAKILANISHRNIVTIFEFGYHEESPFIAMELLQGRDLDHAMRETPSMTLGQRIGFVRQALVGLGRAHKAGVVHRDIKPANLFVTMDGEVKILDFGVARIDGGSMTANKILGSEHYMSPEQWTSAATVDGRSDLFSIGVTLYQLIAGVRPFVGETLWATMDKTLREEADLTPIRTHAPALIPILQKALSKNVAARYQSAADFAAAIESVRIEDATLARPPIVPPPPSPPTESFGEMLAAAAGSGQEHVVRELLALGANVNDRVSHGRTALMEAAKGGHTAIAALLLERGADGNAADDSGNTPLSGAALAGAADLFSVLMSSGADPDAKSVHGVTVLMEAAEGGNTGIIEQLLRDGRVSLDARDSANNTALSFAIIRGLKPTYKPLLTAGADPNLVRLDGNTCLSVATREGWLDVVRDLLDHGADPNLPGVRPPALIAAARSDRCDVKIVQLLLDRGANRAARDLAGKTAAMYASERGKMEKLRALIGSGPPLALTIDIPSPPIDTQPDQREEEEASEEVSTPEGVDADAAASQRSVRRPKPSGRWRSMLLPLIVLFIVLGTGGWVLSNMFDTLIGDPPASSTTTTKNVPYGETTQGAPRDLFSRYNATLDRPESRLPLPPVDMAQQLCIVSALNRAESSDGRLDFWDLRYFLNRCAATSRPPRGPSPIIASVQALLNERAGRFGCPRLEPPLDVDGIRGIRTADVLQGYIQCGASPLRQIERLETLGDYASVGIYLVHERDR